MIPTKVTSLFSDPTYCTRVLSRITRHFGFYKADKPYTCMLVVPHADISFEILHYCYVVHVRDDLSAFAAEIELVRREGTTDEFYFGSFLSFVHEGMAETGMTKPGTHIVLGPSTQFLEFPAVTSESLTLGSRSPVLPTL